MDYKDYKKSYKGLIIYLMAFFAVLIIVGILSVWKNFMPALIIVNTMTVGITGLMYVIYKTENVYWINGIDYEKALLASSERRKDFALRHLKRMGKAAIFGLVISGMSLIFEWNSWIVYVIVIITFIGSAISTMNFKL